MQDILIVLLCITLGMATGSFLRRNMRFLVAADRASLYAVYVLLFILGARLGTNEKLLAELPVLGGKALLICLCSMSMSIFFLMPVRSFFSGGAPAGGKAASGSGPSPFMGSLRILSSFALGVLLGYLALVPLWMADSTLATYAFFFLVFAVGIGLGADLKAFGIIRDMRLRILAVPLLIVLGSVAGGLAASFILPGLSVKDALCVSAGLGYYSLSSILIENAGNSALASVALLSNILREVVAILTAPLLVRYCGRLAPVGAAGSTAMDTGLPVIARFSGERVAVIAVFSGMTLTLLVPFLVMAALQL